MLNKSVAPLTSSPLPPLKENLHLASCGHNLAQLRQHQLQLLEMLNRRGVLPQFDSLDQCQLELAAHDVGSGHLVIRIAEDDQVGDNRRVEALLNLEECLNFPHVHILGEVGLVVVASGNDLHLLQDGQQRRRPLRGAVLNPAGLRIRDDEGVAHADGLLEEALRRLGDRGQHPVLGLRGGTVVGAEPAGAEQCVVPVEYEHGLVLRRTLLRRHIHLLVGQLLNELGPEVVTAYAFEHLFLQGPCVLFLFLPRTHILLRRHFRWLAHLPAKLQLACDKLGGVCT
mmetsp:Transcript_87081/g.221797  ORF Transcript_87081/g.221797 Transcript_87081/m.221797 type:complete len:284 (-) Transcript_87081:13-864(-)